ncbi:MAG: hypothetical protein WBM39_06890, partial [Parasphingorhabdus sp.]
REFGRETDSRETASRTIFLLSDVSCSAPRCLAWFLNFSNLEIPEETHGAFVDAQRMFCHLSTSGFATNVAIAS